MSNRSPNHFQAIPRHKGRPPTYDDQRMKEIRRLIDVEKLSLQEVADRIQVTKTRVCQILKGPAKKTVTKAGPALNIIERPIFETDKQAVMWAGVRFQDSAEARGDAKYHMSAVPPRDLTQSNMGWAQ